MHCFREGAENHAHFGQFSLEGGGYRDRVKHGIHRHTRFFNTSQNFLLKQRNTELFIHAQQFRVHLIQRCRAGGRFGRGIIMQVLIINFRIMNAGPVGLLHGLQPAIGVKAPFGQPLRLVFLGGNEPDNVLVQAFG